MVGKLTTIFASHKTTRDSNPKLAYHNNNGNDLEASSPKSPLPPLALIPLEFSPKHDGKQIACIGYSNFDESETEEDPKIAIPDEKLEVETLITESTDMRHSGGSEGGGKSPSNACQQKPISLKKVRSKIYIRAAVVKILE